MVAGLNLLATLASVGFAVFAQHQFGLLPCAWCVVQRMIFLAIGLVSVTQLIRPRPVLVRMVSSITVLLAAAGIYAAIQQHIYATNRFECQFSIAERIIEWSGLNHVLAGIFAPRVSCAESETHLLGLPFEYWSVMLFVWLAAASISLHLKSPWLRPRCRDISN